MSNAKVAAKPITPEEAEAWSKQLDEMYSRIFDVGNIELANAIQSVNEQLYWDIIEPTEA